MPRERTGMMKFTGGEWRVRVTVTTTDGKTERPWYALGTADEAEANRRREKLIRELDGTDAKGSPRFEPYAEAWIEERRTRGVAMVDTESGILRNYAYATLAKLFLGDIRPRQLRAILDAAVAQGKSQQTIKHIKATLGRVFRRAYLDEIIAENPMDKVELPVIREVRKERELLNDDEFATFVTHPAVDLELQLLGLAARCEGGMRTRDLTAWTWDHFDLERFAWCVIPRTKTGRPQRMEIPPLVAERLHAWWEKHGRPRTEPVFPVTRGRRRGEARKTRGVSFADRLRRGLVAANITRRELHHETPFSLPVDFHSFRRAFATALADAGVNEQQAMALTGHADSRAHKRYVLLGNATRPLPAAALPRIVGEARPVAWPAAADGAPRGAGQADRTTSAQAKSQADGAVQRLDGPTERADDDCGPRLARRTETESPSSEKRLGKDLALFAGPKFLNEIGAGDGIRTRDPQLGKLMLYQLSYSRERAKM